jgi:hypothetical protein
MNRKISPDSFVAVRFDNALNIGGCVRSKIFIDIFEWIACLCRNYLFQSLFLENESTEPTKFRYAIGELWDEVALHFILRTRRARK